MRKRLPEDLAMLQGGAAEVADVELGATPSAVLVETEISTPAVATEMDLRSKAKMQGYEGDPCGDCGNYTLVRNGTCMKCNTCGATSGCS